MLRELAAQFLALAEKQAGTVPVMIGHRLMGTSLMCTGDIVEGRAHYDRAVALYNPAEHRPLATRFGQDVRVAILSYRSLVLWLLGVPEAALADTERALMDAREIGHAATLMYAQVVTSLTLVHCGNYATANTQTDEVVALADKMGSLFWKALGRINRACNWAQTGKASDAVQMLTPALTTYRSTGAAMIGRPRARLKLGQRQIGRYLSRLWWSAHGPGGKVALVFPLEKGHPVPAIRA